MINLNQPTFDVEEMIGLLGYKFFSVIIIVFSCQILTASSAVTLVLVGFKQKSSEKYPKVIAENVFPIGDYDKNNKL